MEENPKSAKSNRTIFLPKPINFLGKFLSSVCSGSLFSSIVTLYALVLLYFPTLFLEIVFSPVFISTGILLLALLRLGAIQRTQDEFLSIIPQQNTTLDSSSSSSSSPQEDQIHAPHDTHTHSGQAEAGRVSDRKPYYSDSFVEWNVRAPLEVIYEEYGEGEEEEEEEEEEDGNHNALNEKTGGRVFGLERYPSLSMYYPESDSDSSSDGDFAAMANWESSEGAFFKWNEEDREELIEIALDGKRNCHVEEDNLIEIDIFPARPRGLNI